MTAVERQAEHTAELMKTLQQQASRTIQGIAAKI
jgi:hypothetical protein